jgi:hypothetical protein
VSDEFEDDLEAVFGEKAGTFSSELRTLLRQMWRQGFLAGVQKEREGASLDLSQAVESACGEYLCVPLPKALVVSEAAETGLSRHVDRARANPLEMEPDQLIKEIIKAAEEMDRVAPRREGEFLLVRHDPAPRVAKPRPNKNGDVFTVEALEGSIAGFSVWGSQTITSTTPRLKQHFGSWQTPSTGTNFVPSGTDIEDPD